MAAKTRLWGRAAVASLGLSLWLQFFFLRPLREEAAEMVGSFYNSSIAILIVALLFELINSPNHDLKFVVDDVAKIQHERQLDPTQIVMIPYDLTRLCLFVAGVAFVYLLTASNLTKNLPYLVGATPCTFLAYIVYGAPLNQNPWHTLTAAFYLMLLVQWDIPVIFNERKLPISSSLDIMQRLSAAASHSALNNNSPADRIAVFQTQTIMGLTIVLHILRLYDRGWQAQRWPIPTILGATTGWIAGLWFGLLAESRFIHRPLDKGNL